MCRVLVYLGKPILIEKLLYQTDNSLIKQALGKTGLHLGGFGMFGWNDKLASDTIPLQYKSITLPFFDKNLRCLAQSNTVTCLLAHVRGVIHNFDAAVIPQNLHPFKFRSSHFCLAHNGFISNINTIKRQIFDQLDDDLIASIEGNTDTELIYALLLQKLRLLNCPQTPKNIVKAIQLTIKELTDLRKRNFIYQSSQLNLYLSDGNSIIAVRYAFNYGMPYGLTAFPERYFQVWYARGKEYSVENNKFRMRYGNKKTSLIISSEPLTQDTSTWLPVPEYTIMIAKKNSKGEITIEFEDIDVNA